MLEKALAETDPDTTGHRGDDGQGDRRRRARRRRDADLDAYDQQLMTAVVEQAEKAGKQVKPLIVPTNNPLHAVLKTAMDLQAHELIMGASNKYTADEQLEQIAFYWINLHDGNAGAADGAHPQPRARHVPRPRRRQPHPEDQRAAGAIGGGAAGGGRRRRPRAAAARRQPGEQRPVPGRADDARPAGGAGLCCRWSPTAASRSTATAPIHARRGAGRASSAASLTLLDAAEGRRRRRSWSGCQAGPVRPDHPAAAGRVAGRT